MEEHNKPSNSQQVYNCNVDGCSSFFKSIRGLKAHKKKAHYQQQRNGEPSNAATNTPTNVIISASETSTNTSTAVRKRTIEFISQDQEKNSTIASTQPFKKRTRKINPNYSAALPSNSQNPFSDLFQLIETSHTIAPRQDDLNNTSSQIIQTEDLVSSTISGASFDKNDDRNFAPSQTETQKTGSGTSSTKKNSSSNTSKTKTPPQIPTG